MGSTNTRRFERVELISDVYFEQDHEEIAACWTDICASGVFVQTQNPLPTGHQVKLRLRITPDGELYRAVGIVKHSLKWVGMGVEFTHLHPAARKSIEYLAGMKM
jgi:PilZ domain